VGGCSHTEGGRNAFCEGSCFPTDVQSDLFGMGDLTRGGRAAQHLPWPGYFGIDAGLSKMWNVTECKTLRFAWEVFNVTNSVRFDAAGSLIGQTLTNITGFGIYNTQLTTPRVMQ
jgi:hypothetical protein